MGRRRGHTIEDVARAAGVSISAVSFALNDKGNLGAATRARIKQAAADLDYQADALARGLRRMPMGTIGIVVRPLDALGEYALGGVDFFSRLIAAAAVAGMDRGLGVMLVPNLLKSPVPAFAYALDGYVVVDPEVDDPVVRRLEERGIPYVSIGRDVARPDSTRWVACDDRALREALGHVVSAGARDVALVTGTDANAWNQELELAYRSWMTGAGLGHRVLSAPEAAGIPGGRAVAARLLGEGLPDAVLCATGRQAVGVVEELTGRGVGVPSRVLVATASDSEHARLSAPAVTAIDMHPEGLAASAVDMLQDVIHGRPVPEGLRLPTTLLPRASTHRPAPEEG
ncbi:LacI family DNA-binding transcriptional regulator [Streptomyces sp. NPDC004284]|uniref:LacI family DNA-binding transcriptional regulator n=1 Tax=Streptomyces sp. NPDC004284 TaxID=3364695 RepID=UPI00368C0724